MQDPDLALEIAKGVFAGTTASFLFVMLWIAITEDLQKRKRRKEYETD